MFKKIKINYINGKLRQIRFFNIPIIQYEKTFEGKLKKVDFPLLRKPKTNRPVAYLKFNSKNWLYSIFCLHHWINIVVQMDCDFYIICDDANIEYKILSAIPFYFYNIKFLKSNRKYFKKSVDKICAKRWKNAAYSHLTTYLHAKKHNIKEFWNIDADDTSFFEEPHIVAQALLKVEDYARKNNFDAFSLDMHRTSFHGLHWTFGVTYTQMNKDIEQLIKDKNASKLQEAYYKYVLDSDTSDSNLDSYFTILKDKNKLNLATFNIDNIYFMHWGICSVLEFYKQLQISKNGMLHYSVAHALDNNRTSLKVFDDVINLDLGIDEQNSHKFLKKVLFGYADKLDILNERYMRGEVRGLYETIE